MFQEDTGDGMAARISIIGDGGWGTALALLLLENGHSVTVWGPFPDYIKTIQKHRENELYLPGVKLPAELNWTADREAAVEKADVAVLAVPTKFMRSVLTSFAGVLPASCRVVSVAKGLDQQTRKRMTQLAEEIIGHAPVAVLSGPSHAEEVSRRIPTAVCVASGDKEYSRSLQNIFSNARFRVYTSDDVAGVELGGALKNIVAIGVGISDGIGFGDNTRAALITRGLVEITRLGCALGAKKATFAGLSGLGDLIVTCTSKFSRNRGVGERLGRGETIDHILGDMKQVAEGIWNCSVARELAHEKKVEIPITDQVYAVIHDGKDPRDAVTSLMTRDLKAEG
jgi:glycerol-3-phosphate dehydrogenase (NAD(P)+)